MVVKIFNVLIIKDSNDINYENMFSIINPNGKKINIIQAENKEDAEKIANNIKINLLLVTEPFIFTKNIENNKLILKKSGEIISINFKDILFIESNKHKFIIHKTDNTSITLSGSISSINEKIKNSNLIRCHRSYIVNIEEIYTIDKSSDPWIIKFNNSNKISYISRTYRNIFLDIFNNN